MGKGWDKTGVANDVTVWAECLRVLKPGGGYLLAFSGTRTYHRMVCAVEDAGLRSAINWHGSTAVASRSRTTARGVAPRAETRGSRSLWRASR